MAASRRKRGQRKGGRVAALRRKGLGPKVASRIATGRKARKHN